jgi:hypothetical protein
LSQEKSEEVVGYIQCQHKMRRANTAKDKPETTMTRFFIASIAALLLATEATSAEKMAVVEPALPPHFSGVWCYNKIASEEAIEDVAIYDRGENIPGCANRGGFTIWPNGGGYTFGRFDVVRNSCEFEKIDLIESSEGEKYKARVACDNSGEDADDPEDHEIEHIDLIIQYDGNDRLIISNP